MGKWKAPIRSGVTFGVVAWSVNRIRGGKL